MMKEEAPKTVGLTAGGTTGDGISLPADRAQG